MFGCVVEDTPSLAVVVGLPRVVVGVAVGILLALELNRLRRARVLRGNIEIEFITQIARRIWNCGLLDEVVAARICGTAGDPEIGRAAAQGRTRDSLRHVVNRALAGTAVITTATAGLPAFLILNIRDDRCASRRGRCVPAI